MLRKILVAPIAGILFATLYVFDAIRFAVMSPLLAVVFPALLLALVGGLIGLITGFFWGVHLIAAVVGSIFFLITWPRSQRKQSLEMRALSYAQALWGAVALGLACYFVGSLVE